MYGKWVELELGEDFSVKVHVLCTLETSEAELQILALRKLVAATGKARYQHVE